MHRQQVARASNIASGSEKPELSQAAVHSDVDTRSTFRRVLEVLTLGELQAVLGEKIIPKEVLDRIPQSKIPSATTPGQWDIGYDFQSQQFP